MTLLRVDLTPIDANHRMARMYYSSADERQDITRVTIDFDVTYLLHVEDEEPMIFAYVAEDERSLLREHGLLAADEQE